MINLIISFCEGQHDIAFLSRILLINGFKFYDKKIKDFPSPLNTQFKNKLALKSIADSKLGFQPNYIIPSVALIKDNTIAFLHNLGGDGREKERDEILEMYKNLIGDKEQDEFTSDPEISFRFMYFFDADNVGIQVRVDELNVELNLSGKVEHNKISRIDGFEWGCYIFHKDTDKGDLEDILIDLMMKDNETIFSSCEDYIKANRLSEDRMKEFICTEDTEYYKPQVKFKEKKSIISIAGQLQFSGMNNSVIISKSDYIRKSDLEQNNHCINIKELFKW